MKNTENRKMCAASGSHCLMAVRWNVRHKLKSYCVARPAELPATPLFSPSPAHFSSFLVPIVLTSSFCVKIVEPTYLTVNFWLKQEISECLVLWVFWFLYFITESRAIFFTKNW